MKRFVCILLALLLACGAALAETAPEAAAETPEEKLTRMLPVLDGLARVMGSHGEPAYDPEDPAFVWEQLYQLGVNWPADDAPADGEIILPAEAARAWAAASFAGLDVLPELPETVGDPPRIRPAGDGEAYILAPDAPRQVYIIIERYAPTETGYLVNFGLYESAYDVRLGGLTAALTELPPAEDPEAEALPLAVTAVAPESEADFADLAPIACAIRREAPEAALLEELLLPAEARYAELAEGSAGIGVTALQRRLRALGYSCGAEDGAFGPETRRAVRLFQEALGLAQDGAADSELQERLFAPDAPPFAPYVNLSEGKQGVRVEELQERLRALGYLAKPTDGRYDGRTKEAVRLFQRTARLAADGIAGEKTLAALGRDDAPRCRNYIDLLRGDTGPRVTEMQEQLIELKLLTGRASGVYDAGTAQAVKAFMQARSIREDGDAGASAAAIEAMFGPEATPSPSPTAQTASPAPEKATPKPTRRPTAAPTDAPSAAPDEPTAAPTESTAPSEEPTEKPPETPDAPTAAPTTAAPETKPPETSDAPEPPAEGE